MMQLGGNIELTGFRELDPGSLVIIKKMVGNYARKIADQSSNFEKLSLTLKIVHETEASKKFEIKAKALDNGKPSNSEVTERNVFVAVDKALKKLSGA